MTPAFYIRTEVFGFDTQQEFANALGTSQANVSRWETDVLEIERQWQDKIIALAEKRKISFDANWFFKVPVSGRKVA